MFECFHCLHKSLVWDCDYDFEDFNYEGKGIVQILHCSNCGAEVEYRIKTSKDNLEKKEKNNNENNS